MFIDDVKNRYTYLNSMKNVVHEEPIERPLVLGRMVTLHADLAPLIDKLLRERPTWRFKSIQPLLTNPTPTVSRFHIYDGDEELGELWVERHWRNETIQYFFRNFRINKERMRGGPAYSTKPDVVVKRILKAFHLKTPQERAVDAYNATLKTVRENCNKTRWPYQRARAAVERELLAYAIRNWDNVKDHLDPSIAASNFPTLAMEHQQNEALEAVVEHRRGVTVALEANDTYSVAQAYNDTYTTQRYNDSTLPEYLRSALGLLKLVEDTTYIPDVGLRVSNNLFYITARGPAIEG